MQWKCSCGCEEYLAVDIQATPIKITNTFGNWSDVEQSGREFHNLYICRNCGNLKVDTEEWN